MKQQRLDSNHTWTPSSDFREICACQSHARRERTIWRRTLRAAKRRGVTFLVTVPLAFGAIGLEAVNLSFPALAHEAITLGRARSLPQVSTPLVGKSFLSSERGAATFSLAVAKEEFFRTEIPFGPIIYSEAVKNDLSPELVAAIVESESDFQADLVSNKNARGLMQIVPETGRLMGCRDLFNPHANVAAGTKYFRYLLNRFGDERLALAAYNAGEGTVERVGGVPDYRETTDYLSRVTTRARQYQSRVQNRYRAVAQMQASALR